LAVKKPARGHRAAGSVSGEVQNAQRRAAIGTSLSDCAKRTAHHHRDREIENVATEDKLFETLQHIDLPSRIFDIISQVPLLRPG
jgi:hypothetical protein